MIALEDHSEAHSDESRALWAKQVSIDEWVLVGSGGLGAGSYVVWNCTVETLEVGVSTSGKSMRCARCCGEMDCELMVALRRVAR